MKKDRKEFLKVYSKVRKTMPPCEKIIMPKKNRYERDNWRYNGEEDDGEDYKGYIDLDRKPLKE